ncbi:hypothetical protein Q3E60_10125 [Enterococcus faecium]|uniref:hypothetical protein n=1 Tax=Enterococcus faecium TaxID=1352 RepID=UPI0003300267|nr:hypothetical protein [Enterococcus faecium]EOH55905.1 hypothetical protein UA3_01088 [Enterococcus faecium EnGen0263]MDQ8428099.1 hypothetical protein [Enterococcus faecium]MDQ8570300.1 hypothetical protein [Enterococcus faecium]
MLFRRYMNQKFDNELILLEQKNKKRRAEINRELRQQEREYSQFQERVNDRMNRFIPDRNK